MAEGQEVTAIRTRSDAEWLELARQVAADFASTIEARHRQRRLPHDEIRRLKESGLSAIFIAAEHGGGGASWPVVTEVVRELAAADGSAGALFGYHLLGAIHLRKETAARRAEIQREIARDRLWLAGVANPRDDDIKIEPAGRGFILNGRKTFCTGAAFADRLTIVGRRSDTGEPATAFLPAGRDGIRYNQDWDHLGLDRTESGSFDLVDVHAAAEEIYTFRPEDAASHATAIRVPVNQLIFTNLYVGFALGAFRAARHYTRTVTRPWLQSAADSASDDPLVIAQFGELWIALQSAIALADRAALKVEELMKAGHAFTPAMRGEAAVAVATAKVQASRVSLDISTRIYDVMGARATHNRHAFDRFWRDSRTHTLHDSLAYKIQELGNFALNERYPPISQYS
jgi:alkylation response protein AidB-like acyl-CoA dehydrogenase